MRTPNVGRLSQASKYLLPPVFVQLVDLFFIGWQE